MEKSVDILFTQQLLEAILDRFGLDRSFQKLGSFENYVFEVSKHGIPFILRVTHSTHRRRAELEAELDWIQYLAEGGMLIPAALPSQDGRLVEELAAGSTSFFAVLFEKAPGRKVTVSDYSGRLFYEWGKTTGAMHRLTKLYEPGDGINRRSSWRESDLLNIARHFPKEDILAAAQAERLKAEALKLPVDREVYGLIHTDLHSGNFFWDGEHIAAFDFDDACYHFYLSDIAIPVYYSATAAHFYGTKEERNEFAASFLSHFLRGYETEQQVPNLAGLPLFLKLRDVELYSVFNKKIMAEDRSERENHWLKEIKERIEKGEAIAELEWNSL